MKLDAQTKKYFEWIREKPCCICNGGAWEINLGVWHNTVSHVLKRGSTRRNDHFGSTVSMCCPCHSKYEIEPPLKRLRFKKLAEELYEEFKNK